MSCGGISIDSVFFLLKLKIPIEDFFSYVTKFSADLATFTEGTLNGKLHFLCSVSMWLLMFRLEYPRIASCLIRQTNCLKMGFSPETSRNKNIMELSKKKNNIDLLLSLQREYTIDILLTIFGIFNNSYFAKRPRVYHIFVGRRGLLRKCSGICWG